MSLVLDCSATMANIFEEERTIAIEDVFSRIAISGGWIPALWKIEVANTLNVGMKRGRINMVDRQKALLHLSSLPIFLDSQTDFFCWNRTIGLAEQYKLAVYDATYLELALRRSLPRATLDQDLRTAAQAEGIPLLGL